MQRNRRFIHKHYLQVTSSRTLVIELLKKAKKACKGQPNQGNKKGHEYYLWQRVWGLLMQTSVSSFKQEVSARPKSSFMTFLRRIYPNIGYANYQKEDCDAHWNYTSFKDKVILDLGADYGSTLRYFLKKGARLIIAVEGNPKLAQELKKRYQSSGKVICEELMIDSAEDLNKFICQKDIDVAKVDIEGAEKFLLSLPSIVNIPTWLIETHSVEIDRLLIIHFQEQGFKVYRQSALGANMLKAVLNQ
jgi:hypothetical protein